jgi:large subunit ribosomal protein L3
MKFILGKKIEMTQLFKEDGKVIPVTSVLAGPCVITQIRQEEKDGYTAVQTGFGKCNKINKPLKGHLKDLGNFAKLREFRVSPQDVANLAVGQEISVSTFDKGDKVKVIGVTKGMGFQGVVKRHGFHGQNKTHGTKDQLRMPGSIGSTGPARVFKGTRMGGHMGSQQSTLKDLEIIEIDLEKNILYIKGGLPGSRNSLILISGEGELKTTRKEKSTEVETVNELDQTSVVEEAKETKPVEEIATEEKTEAVSEANDTPEVAIEVEKQADSNSEEK